MVLQNGTEKNQQLKNDKKTKNIINTFEIGFGFQISFYLKFMLNTKMSSHNIIAINFENWLPIRY